MREMNLPIGTYIPGSSLLHRLDARVKMLCLITLIVAIIYASSIPGYGIMALLVGLLIFLSRLDLRTAFASIKRIIPFFLVIFLMNCLFYDQEQPLWAWWIFRPSAAGAIMGLNVVLKLILLMLLFNILMSTTAPMKVTSALVSLLHPLGYIGIPVADLALMISVAIQFIPTLMEETEMIRKAQTARGARFESPRLREKAESIMPLVIPIFLGAFRRADELAMAMEARGYRGGKRRVKKSDPLQKYDFAALAITAAICLVQIFAL